jgi:regulatory protein
VSGRITDIRRTGGEQSRVTVFVDGVEAFTVSERIADELGLTVGGELAPAAAEAMTADEARVGAKEAALRLLAVRARSEGELRDRLRRKGFDGEVVESVIGSLATVGLVDDEQFARAWADEKVRLRPVGPRRLTQELLVRHVDRDVADRVVDQTYREHPERELARRALEKRTRVSGGAGDRKRRARLHSFLVRRGFSHSVAAEVLDELEGESDA